MNYISIYDNIIQKNRIFENKSIYTEKHHIIPKCLGGGNQKENIIKLSYREHFLCHWLLVKIHPKNEKLKAAFAKMLGVSKTQKNKIISSWMFATVKRNIRDTHFHWLRDKKPWNQGLKGHSPQRAWNKGISTGNMSEEQKLKISNTLINRYKTKPHPRKGKSSWCEGTVGIVKAWNKNKTMPKFKCKFCSAEMDQLNLNKWHNEKCKQKNLI